MHVLEMVITMLINFTIGLRKEHHFRIGCLRIKWRENLFLGFGNAVLTRASGDAALGRKIFVSTISRFILSIVGTCVAKKKASWLQPPSRWRDRFTIFRICSQRFVSQVQSNYQDEGNIPLGSYSQNREFDAPPRASLLCVDVHDPVV